MKAILAAVAASAILLIAGSASAEEMTAQVQEVVSSAQALSTMAQDLQSVVSSFNLNGRGDGLESAARSRQPESRRSWREDTSDAEAETVAAN